MEKENKENVFPKEKEKEKDGSPRKKRDSLVSKDKEADNDN
jgi:hypothetical protein